MQTSDHPDWPEWQRIIYHEAGHAAVSMKLWRQSAPIVVLNSRDKDGNLRKGGRFKVLLGLQFDRPDLEAPENKPTVEQVMVCAAGGITELIKFGHESEGFYKDKFQIDSILKIRRDEEAQFERDNDYPRTRQVVTENERAIEAIAARAMQSFIDRGLLENDFTEVDLLDSDSVAEIYRSINQGS